MTRPIVWAAFTLASIAISATAASGRLAGALGLRSAPTAATAGPPRTLTISGDLRGHFFVHPTIDGRRVRMLVDTGASQVALSYEDARAAGLRLKPGDFTRFSSTANGVVAVAPVRIREMRLGDIVIRDVEALVIPPGRLDTSLLGMSFLRRLNGFEIGQGRLTLRG